MSGLLLAACFLVLAWFLLVFLTCFSCVVILCSLNPRSYQRGGADETHGSHHRIFLPTASLAVSHAGLGEQSLRLSGVRRRGWEMRLVFSVGLCRNGDLETPQNCGSRTHTAKSLCDSVCTSFSRCRKRLSLPHCLVVLASTNALSGRPEIWSTILVNILGSLEDVRLIPILGLREANTTFGDEGCPKIRGKSSLAGQPSSRDIPIWICRRRGMEVGRYEVGSAMPTVDGTFGIHAPPPPFLQESQAYAKLGNQLL